METAKHWRWATYAVAIVWVAAMARLFIADVWDETSALVIFGDSHQSAWQLVFATLRVALPSWRPLPTVFVIVTIHALPADVAWPLLRIVNMLMILGAVALLVHSLDAWSECDARRDFFFAFATLFSAGGIIVAGWFANIFDASVLLLVAWGLVRLTRRRFLTAGLIFGMAFFCKETAAMTLPLLLLLVAIERLSPREAAKAAVPTVAIGILYFGLRGLVARPRTRISSGPAWSFRLWPASSRATGGKRYGARRAPSDTSSSPSRSWPCAAGVRERPSLCTPAVPL